MVMVLVCAQLNMFEVTKLILLRVEIRGATFKKRNAMIENDDAKMRKFISIGE